MIGGVAQILLKGRNRHLRFLTQRAFTGRSDLLSQIFRIQRADNAIAVRTQFMRMALVIRQRGTQTGGGHRAGQLQDVT